MHPVRDVDRAVRRDIEAGRTQRLLVADPADTTDLRRAVAVGQPSDDTVGARIDVQSKPPGHVTSRNPAVVTTRNGVAAPPSGNRTAAPPSIPNCSQ